MCLIRSGSLYRENETRAQYCRCIFSLRLIKKSTCFQFCNQRKKENEEKRVFCSLNDSVKTEDDVVTVEWNLQVHFLFLDSYKVNNRLI